MSYPYSGLVLIERLAKQHQNKHPGLFQQGTFILNWRAKVGSFPHPDVETLVSAGEPCGSWKPETGRPEDKRNVGQNWDGFEALPLHGYIPAASIRGMVRAWVQGQSPELQTRMEQLLGFQRGNTIQAGKIVFLDAFPENPTQLSLDIVNPQQNFQVYHEGQSTPLSQYTLGDGHGAIPIRIAIRGIPGSKITDDDVHEVWSWVERAINALGVGSRTASGYGSITVPDSSIKPSAPTLFPGYASKQLSFKLYSQGNAGPYSKTMEFRPSHWRGWLRSWLLRFFLGVMTRANAELTVTELMGGIEPETVKGKIRLKVLPGQIWGEKSEDEPYFYSWSGDLILSAPQSASEPLLNEVILPILRMAVMLGGAGRGWRRPLHIFEMRNNNDNRWDSSRGSHLVVNHRVKPPNQDAMNKPFGLGVKPEDWQRIYGKWSEQIQSLYPDRYLAAGSGENAESISPTTCSIYVVPGPQKEPIDRANHLWAVTDRFATRGDGMDLIYKPKYKRKAAVGGDAANGNAHCSWVSIKRISKPVDCQEVVCLFLGKNDRLRLNFLSDLANIDRAVYVFGKKPDRSD